MSYIENLFSKIQILKSGTACLNNLLSCDGCDSNLKKTVFTHISQNHINFESCLGKNNVYSSKLTCDLLETLHESDYSFSTQYIKMEFGEGGKTKLTSEGDYLTLFPSRHVLGASHVLLETSDELKIIYTKDIAPDDRPQECDILVINSAYEYTVTKKKTSSNELNKTLIDKINKLVDNKTPICIYARSGNLQYLMSLLSDHKIISGIPFFGDAINIKLADIYRLNGYNIRGEILDFLTYEYNKHERSGQLRIEFRSDFNMMMDKVDTNLTKIFTFDDTQECIIDNSEKNILIDLSTRLKYCQLINYIKEAKPQVVVVNNTNGNYGKILSASIFNELNIPSRTLP